MRSPPERFTFFIDRSLGRKDIAETLRAAGAGVELHDDHFPPDAEDVTWLAAVGARGWAALSKDERIMRRELELNALKRAKAAAFVLTAQDVTGAEMAAAFVKALPRMQRLLSKYDRPLLASTTSGTPPPRCSSGQGFPSRPCSASCATATRGSRRKPTGTSTWRTCAPA